MHAPLPQRRSRLTAPAVGRVLVGVLVAAVGLAACTSSGGSTAGPGAVSHSASPVATPSISAAAAVLPFDVPATFTVHDGKLVSATVVGAAHGTVLAGTVAADGGSWVSDGLPTPSATYNVSAQVTDGAGATHTLALSLKISAIPASQKLNFSVTPLAGWTVGVNAPIVVRFLKPVTDRAAVERGLVVSSSTPVIGSWHWISAAEVHFRPQDPWPAHSKVEVALNLVGVKAGPGLWGTTNTHVPFSVGDAHLTTVDGKTHTLTARTNGKTWAVWPTSLGRPEFVTRSGNYVVLAKTPTRRMTSCNAAITCVKTDKNYYDLEVDWDVRLSWSGTFIHSAPWSVKHQGVDNVSHGCINLSPARAIAYFNWARYGDLVTVTNTSRTAADLVASGDPGMTDWNVSWDSYVGKSALGSEITTEQLAG